MKRSLLRRLEVLEPSRILLFGYLFLMILGFGLLMLPWFHNSAESAVDHLFTAVSAISTTGLSTLSVSQSYNLGGQILVLLLIQIGGVGYMSVASFIILGSRKRISNFTSRLLRTDFSLGDSAELIGFIKGVIYFTVAIELLGAVALSIIFHNKGVEAPLWNGIFHSVSAFCTAGFSLFDDSLVAFADSTWLTLVISVLSLAGSIGFLVFVDLYQRFLGNTKKLAFTTRIILRFTGVLLVVATIAMLLLETTFEGDNGYHQFLLSFFQSMTALSTVGFNTYPIGNLSLTMLYILVVLMLIGASPAGTGGGIKSTTITAMYAVVKATLMGDKRILFMGKEIPDRRLRLAAANFFFYVAVLYACILLLSYTEELDMFALMFEASSAIGTVGLSMGVTADLSVAGKCIIIFLMFLGRLGAATFGLALFKGKDNQEEEGDVQTEDVLI
jgi:trk system potassium uptake protein TrkH